MSSTKPPISRWDLDNGQGGAADINLLCDLVYGESMHSIRHQLLPRQQAPAAVGEQAGQRIKDQDTLKSYSDRANLHRTDVVRGPFKPTQGPMGAVDKEGAIHLISSQICLAPCPVCHACHASASSIICREQMTECLSACRSICLSACRSICLSVCLSVYLSAVCLSAYFDAKCPHVCL
jgi:hypothetical protein